MVSFDFPFIFLKKKKKEGRGIWILDGKPCCVWIELREADLDRGSLLQNRCLCCCSRCALFAARIAASESRYSG